MTVVLLISQISHNVFYAKQKEQQHKKKWLFRVVIMISSNGSTEVSVKPVIGGLAPVIRSLTAVCLASAQALVFGFRLFGTAAHGKVIEISGYNCVSVSVASDSCAVSWSAEYFMYRSSLVSPHWIWTWFHLIAPQNMEVSFILFLNNFQGFSQRSCYPIKPDNNIHIVHRCSLYSYFDNY